MKKIALIGGTGLYELSGYKVIAEHEIKTQYSDSSIKITEVAVNNTSLYFLSRHGQGHQHAPHLINYRANIQALKECGVSDIVSVNAVGGISENCKPATLVIPNQLIDYSHSREHTFFDGSQNVQYCDFSQPYSEELQLFIKTKLNESSIAFVAGGVYGCTQGPRLETSAEIKRLAKDGCDVVGMTGMPEATLAREADINYVSCSIVVNWAAGINNDSIDMESIKQNLSIGMRNIKSLVKVLV